MPTSTSKHRVVSVDITARGTTVLFSFSVPSTIPTRDSGLLLLASDGGNRSKTVLNKSINERSHGKIHDIILNIFKELTKSVVMFTCQIIQLLAHGEGNYPIHKNISCAKSTPKGDHLSNRKHLPDPAIISVT